MKTAIIVLSLILLTGCSNLEKNNTSKNTSKINNNNTQVSLQKTDNKPTSNKKNNSTITNCGTSKSFINTLPKYFDTANEKDISLICMGDNFFSNCKNKTQVILKSLNKGDIQYSIIGEKDNKCIIKIKYGGIKQIQSDNQKKFANTYIECELNIKNILEYNPFTGTSSYDYFNKPGILAAYIYYYTGTYLNSPDAQCSGTMIDVLNKIQSTKE